MYCTTIGSDEEQCCSNEDKYNAEIVSGCTKNEIRACFGHIDIILRTAPETASFEISQHRGGLFYVFAVEYADFDFL